MGDLKKVKEIAKKLIPSLETIENLMDEKNLGYLNITISRESDYSNVTIKGMEEGIVKNNGAYKIKIPERYEGLDDED